ncbi:lysoplasmalogenase family protein [Pseudopelagicola sp. nBUS_20]|uniref:lysoplasmalogenase family protein n=1 Tax=Pseudopelagicola sp. nBUS_20 TaxID=3395317 RepID=UPI003EB89149
MTIVEEIALRQSMRFGFLVVGALVAVVYAVLFCYRGPSRTKTLIKAVPMLAFSAAAGISFGYQLIVSALLLSAVGDIGLSLKGKRAFLIGLIASALALLAYIFHFFALSGYDTSTITFAIFGVLSLVVISDVWIIPHTDTVQRLLWANVVLLATTGIVALSLPVTPLAKFGAFAFLTSEVLVGLHIFSTSASSFQQRSVSILQWLLYVAGQLAILMAVGWKTPLFQIW